MTAGQPTTRSRFRCCSRPASGPSSSSTPPRSSAAAISPGARSWRGVSAGRPSDRPAVFPQPRPPPGPAHPAGRSASPGGRVSRVDGLDRHVFVLIDAFGWEIAQRLGFLSDALPHRAPLRTVLGYSSGAIPTMLTGKSPAEHGHWNLFYYDPEGSPFRWLRGLHFLPDRVLG